MKYKNGIVIAAAGRGGRGGGRRGEEGTRADLRAAICVPADRGSSSPSAFPIPR